jgi:hypothetical protein
MPRGSRPGERRGGRQRGMPNKKTALKNAALAAAAADPNLSPLDFLLSLMRDPGLPPDLRIKMAQAAAPFVHAKPGDGRRGQTAAPKHGEQIAVFNTKKESGSIRSETATINSAAAATTDDASNSSLSPLGFLLGMMRDADAAPELRVRVAQVAAPFVHTKLGRGGSDDRVTSETTYDPGDGFVIEPALARAIRDDKRRLKELLVKHESQPGSPPTAADVQEEAEVREQIAERLRAIEIPKSYRQPEAVLDMWRLGPLGYKAVLTAAEEAKETQLTARLAAYEASPEARARKRISELTTLGYSRRLSAAEKAELESLESLYPRLPPHPDHPYASSFAKFGEVLKRLKEESRLRDEERRQSRERRASLKSEAATPVPNDGFQEFLD